jgi:hypothetical protein
MKKRRRSGSVRTRTGQSPRLLHQRLLEHLAMLLRDAPDLREDILTRPDGVIHCMLHSKTMEQNLTSATLELQDAPDGLSIRDALLDAGELPSEVPVQFQLTYRELQNELESWFPVNGADHEE